MEVAFQLERRVAREIERASLLRRGERVVVAVSGGADSLALLGVLRALATGLDLTLTVAHLNHRLRGPRADRDALVVAALARAWSLPVVVGEVESLPAVSGLEERARHERGRFLERVARSAGASAIALGHTLDDQAETVLMRLGRGAGPAALGAMEPRRADGVVRPLLEVRRAECVRYVEALGLRSVLDESNLDTRFTRNRIRHEVLPALDAGLGVDTARRLADLASHLRVEAELAEAAVSALLDRTGDEGLPVAVVESAGRAAGRVVRSWLLRRGLRLGRRQIEAVVELARRGGPSDGLDAGGGFRVARCYERLVVFPPAEPALEAAVESLEWAIPGTIELPSGWRLTAEPCAPEPRRATAGPRGTDLAVALAAPGLPAALTVRRPLPGDRIRLAGGRRKLSDVLVDARVPRKERSSLAVVSKGADIVWVPGVAAARLGSAADVGGALVLLRAEPVDCRSGRPVVKNQEFRVSFA